LATGNTNRINRGYSILGAGDFVHADAMIGEPVQCELVDYLYSCPQ